MYRQSKCEFNFINFIESFWFLVTWVTTRQYPGPALRACAMELAAVLTPSSTCLSHRPWYNHHYPISQKEHSDPSEWLQTSYTHSNLYEVFWESGSGPHLHQHTKNTGLLTAYLLPKQINQEHHLRSSSHNLHITVLALTQISPISSLINC